MKFTTHLATFVAALALPAISFAAPLYIDNFEVDPTANWTMNGGPSDESANFFFDYSTVGIPKAPNSALADGTRGMKLQANLSGGIFSGMSVSPNGQSFVGDYRVVFDWWSNFNGPFPAGGSGSTNLSTYGVGTAGTTAQWPGGAWDSVFFGATGDGGTTNDYRAYSNGSGGAPGAIWAETSGVYAAGNTAGVTNGSHAYYASLGGNSAPAAQLALYPQQTGATAAGAPGERWHQVVLSKTSTEVKWSVDGLLIATIPLSQAVTMGGNNILFGHSDINPGSSTDVNDVNLLFTLVDNVVVVPEPGTFVLCVLGAIGGLLMRRRS
jgi:hypothetical protein